MTFVAGAAVGFVVGLVVAVLIVLAADADR